MASKYAKDKAHATNKPTKAGAKLHNAPSYVWGKINKERKEEGKSPIGNGHPKTKFAKKMQEKKNK